MDHPIISVSHNCGPIGVTHLFTCAFAHSCTITETAPTAGASHGTDANDAANSTMPAAVVVMIVALFRLPLFENMAILMIQCLEYRYASITRSY